MPLIRAEDGRAVAAADNFVRVGDEDALPADVEKGGAVTVSLARFRRDREQLLARNTPLGVRLKAEENPELLGEDVSRFALIELEFPKFRDGRAFSWARMLRTRLGFSGEIRAVGDFLYDQVNYQRRVGFNAWDAPDHLTPELFDRAFGEMTNVYQPSTDGKKTIRQLRAGL
ncbi:MAG: hypothetical protein BGN85_06070 [Alphaproteobacteria bacterium 64-11]|nr:DUF934 domain-containing protein [Alphaproteobacteria bacterium]OJU11914.1 MAG: hypothetical protein BGN85_06070 [Alphaproteobacteria bacterium 64-11]